MDAQLFLARCVLLLTAPTSQCQRRLNQASFSDWFPCSVRSFRSCLLLLTDAMSSSFSNVRPSILLRPKKVASAAAISNSTHMQMEHEREEARLAAKRDARAQREQERGQRLWGDPEEKAHLAAQDRSLEMNVGGHE